METFKSALRTKDFVSTAELRLSADTGAEQLVAQAKILCADVDALYVTDNQFGRVHMSSLAAAGILIQNGIDTVMQLSCRHRNRVALLSDLLAAREFGITSLVLVRGDKVPRSVEPRPKPVLDISAKELIATASVIKNDERLAQASDFLIGAAATAFNPKSDWKPVELLAKADAGAQFLQTQPCFDLDIVRRYVARLIATKLTRRMNIIVTIGPFPSAENARLMQKRHSKLHIPDWLINRLAQATDPEQEGVDICTEMLQELAEIPGVSGANLMTYGAPETIAAALQASGVCS